MATQCSYLQSYKWMDTYTFLRVKWFDSRRDKKKKTLEIVKPVQG